jgi:hypothetical protein
MSDIEQYRITTRFRGSPDGMRVYTYECGDIVPSKEKPFSPSLAAVAMRNRWARRHREKKKLSSVRIDSSVDDDAA